MSTALPEHLQKLLLDVLAGEVDETSAEVLAALAKHPEFARELNELRAFERGVDAARGERDKILAEARADTTTTGEAAIEARVLALGAEPGPMPSSRPTSLRWMIPGLAAAAAILLIMRSWQKEGGLGEIPDRPPIFLNGEEDAAIVLQRPQQPATEFEEDGEIVLAWDLRNEAIPIDGYNVELLGNDLELLGNYRTSTNTWRLDSASLEALMSAAFVRVRAFDPFGLPHADVVSIPYPRELFVVRD